MKKLLALVLAVLMLATLAVASVSAADEKINLGEFFYDYGRRIHFAGGTTDAAPVTDGVISEGEYDVVYVEPASNGNNMTYDVTNYFSHDDEWFTARTL